MCAASIGETLRVSVAFTASLLRREAFVPDQSESRRQRILIVEDDAVSLRALDAILRCWGHTTDTAASVAEGMEKLDGQDCAILDLNLSDGAGTDVLRRIRDEGRAIRVAVATGTTDRELLADVHALAPDLLIIKPINLNVLLEWLDAKRPG
jgi:CheY-like chemotaxis protein